MSAGKFNAGSRSNVVLVAALLVVLLFAFAAVAHAELFSISTVDSSVGDWNPVAVFQTDPTGDGVPGSTAGQDIVMGKVASMDSDNDDVGDYVYFLVQTASDEGLGENSRVAAMIDCDNDGNFEESEDRLVTYEPFYDTNGGFITILHGDRFGQAVLIPPESEQGQKVGAYYEFGVETVDLGPFPDDPPGLPLDYCQGIVGVRFQTFRKGGVDDVGNFVPPLVYDMTEGGPYTMVNLPTAVSVSSFSASPFAVNYAVLIAVGLLASLFTLGYLVHLRRQSK